VSRSSTLIFGSPGSGKTLLALHFLAEGARRGEKGLYFGFAESGPRLVEKAAKVSLDIRHAVDSGVLRLESRVATETLPDKLALELVDLVRTSGAKRLVLDGLEPFAKEAIDPERTSRFVTALSNELRDLDATVLCTQQTNTLFGPDLYAPLRGVEAILDNIIFLRFFEFRSKLRRLLSILKSRESESDPRLRELQITSSGVTVRGAFASAESILTGQARGRRNVAAKPSTKRASKRARR
jgi:circadian clock protein KaiC